MTSGSSASRAPHRFVGTVVLLTIRGLLLWLVVPLTLLLWLVISLALRRRGISLGQFLGWLDLNLISAIQRTLGDSLCDAPIPWTPLASASTLKHRIYGIDAF